MSFSIFLGSHGLLSRTDYLTVSTTNSVFRLFGEGGKVLLRYFLLWGFSSAVSRHLSLDTGNSFGLKYTAESEFHRFLLKLSIAAPPKRSKIKFKNGNYKSDIISTINLHFK